MYHSNYFTMCWCRQQISVTNFASSLWQLILTSNFWNAKKFWQAQLTNCNIRDVKWSTLTSSLSSATSVFLYPQRVFYIKLSFASPPPVPNESAYQVWHIRWHVLEDIDKGWAYSWHIIQYHCCLVLAQLCAFDCIIINFVEVVQIHFTHRNYPIGVDKK